MTTNGIAEIKAVEDRLNVAERAKLRSIVNLKNAEMAFHWARQNLDVAKREHKEANDDLRDTKAALNDVYSKYEVIEIDDTDEDSIEPDSNTVFNVDTDTDDNDPEPITKADLDKLKPGSRVIIYEYDTDLYFNATIKKLGEKERQGRFQIHIDGLKPKSRRWIEEKDIARIL